MSDNVAPVENGGQGAAPAPAAAAPAAAPAPQNTPAIEWLPNADEVTVGLVQNKGWKSPTDMLTSYQALEKFVGVPADKIVRLPTETSTKEDLDAFYSKLGRPADPKEYGIKAPDGADPAFSQAAAAKFHELGLSTKQAQELTAWYESQGATFGEAQQQAQQAALQAEHAALRQQWGAAFDQRTVAAKEAARQFGVDEATINALEKSMGYAKVMDLFANIGSKLGEASFPGSQRSTNFSGVMTPGQAQAEIRSLQMDKEFRAKYLAGNTEAKARMQQLMQWAHPEQP